jgi:1-acyl-sn-glycerol-3-phosphate acyltransferase
MIVRILRTALFYALFLGQTVVLAIVVGVSALIWKRTRFGWVVAQYWGRSNLFLLRWIAGIRTSVSGAENIPPGACIIAAKHMSDWDIFAILPYTIRPAFIAKRELMDIPLFGDAARTFDTISIDRKKGAEAIPTMMEEARAAVAKGCRIVIFPEGTRKAPLDEPDYRQGIVRMYLELGVPVVPVAVSSGLYWGRNSLVMWPGTARAEFLPPIQQGLNAEAFRSQLIGVIEGVTNRLIAEAIDEGLAGPVPQEWRDTLAARQQAAAARTH